MKRSVFILLISLLLAACSDMSDQPSFKSQEAPRLSAPPAAVPVQGMEVYDGTKPLPNPEPASPESIQKGRELFRINCAMCHGPDARGDGPVGKRMNPPPPSLHSPQVQGLSDFEIFSRLTLGYGRMPAFRNRLTPTERWHLVNFLKHLEPPKQEKQAPSK